MTARQIWEGLLTELSKVNAPSMLLEDFNYFINKSVNQYINKRYNIYDVNQQTADDLRVLKSSAFLDVEKATEGITEEMKEWGAGNAKLFGSTYRVALPLDYLHILNCDCFYKVHKNFKCYDKDNVVRFPAKRLTADAWSTIENNYYNRPMPQRPYFYIHNVNSKNGAGDNPTNPHYGDFEDISGFFGTDVALKFDGTQQQIATKDSETSSNFTRQIDFTDINGKTTVVSTVERETGVRYGNPGLVRMEIRYGDDNTVFELIKVRIDYIKSPQTIRLTPEQVGLTEDTSQIMEFPDYVCQEIINELVRLVMENISDPRLQTNSIVTQSIASPTQQQTTQPVVQAAQA